MPAILRADAGTQRYLLLVLLFCLTWSSAFPAAKIAIAVSPPQLFLGMRFLLAAGILLPWAAHRGALAQLKARDWAGLLALGLLNQAGYNGAAWLGMRSGVSGGLATIIISINPILVAFLSIPFLGERLSFRRIGGLVFGILGVMFVVRNRVAIAGEDLSAIATVAIGTLSLVAGTILFKRWSPKLPLSAIVGVQSLSTGVFLFGVGLATENLGAIALNAQFALALIYTAIIVSIGAFALWFFLLNRGSATSASSLHFIMPPLGLIMGRIVLHEPLHPLDFLGCLPIAFGIWLVTHEPTEAARMLSGLQPENSD